MTKRTKRQIMELLLDEAAGLADGCSSAKYSHKEYLRGMCELIGRVQLSMGEGEGTAENAIMALKEIALREGDSLSEKRCENILYYGPKGVRS